MDRAALIDIADQLQPTESRLMVLAQAIERVDHPDQLEQLRASVRHANIAVERMIPAIAAATNNSTEKLKMVFGPDAPAMASSYLNWMWFRTSRPASFLRNVAITGGFS